MLSPGEVGAQKIQGIGANLVTEPLYTTVYDEIMLSTDADAMATARVLAKEGRLLVGISSGAAVWAAAQLAKRPENAGKMIVALLPDGGERYLSTPMFAD